MAIPEVKKEAKYVLFAACGILINEIIPSFVGKIQIPDLFKTEKLEEDIKDQEILNEREKFHIRKRRPVVNTIKYNKSNKTNAELQNKLDVEILTSQKKIDKIQADIDTFKTINPSLLAT